MLGIFNFSQNKPAEPKKKITIEERMCKELFEEKLLGSPRLYERTLTVFKEAMMPLAIEIANLLLYCYEHDKYEWILWCCETNVKKERYRDPSLRVNVITKMWLEASYKLIGTKPFAVHPKLKEFQIQLEKIIITRDMRLKIESGCYAIKDEDGGRMFAVAGYFTNRRCDYGFAENLIKGHSKTIDWKTIARRIAICLDPLGEDFIIIATKQAFVALSKYMFYQEDDELLFRVDGLADHVNKLNEKVFPDGKPSDFIERSIRYQKIVVITVDGLEKQDYMLNKQIRGDKEIEEQAEIVLHLLINTVFEEPEKFCENFSYLREYTLGYESITALVIVKMIKQILSKISANSSDKFYREQIVDAYNRICAFLEEKSCHGEVLL